MIALVVKCSDFLEYANIGRSDLKASLVGLGTGFRGGINQNSLKVINAALMRGVSLIDTAEIYGDGLSEKIVGEAIKGRRKEVILVTKVSGEHLRYEQVLKAAEGSLRRLATDFIDLYLVHWPNPRVLYKRNDARHGKTSKRRQSTLHWSEQL